MKKILIYEIKTRTIDDPRSYVVVEEFELNPITPCIGGIPPLSVNSEVIHPQTFVGRGGVEVHICMPKRVEKHLFNPLATSREMSEIILRQKDNIQELDERTRIALGKVVKANNLTFWQRVKAVFCGVNV